MQWIFVFIGGGAGSVLRYLIGKHLNTYSEYFLIPYGTFFANVVSCFFLGILIHKQLSSQLNDPIKWIFAIGFCGGLSTFSTFAYELYQYMQRGQMVFGISYLSLSVLLGIGAFIVGLKVSI